MAASYGGNFATPMALVLRGACHMAAAGGDSQSVPSNNYLFATMLACVKPRLGYMSLSTEEANGQSPAVNNWNGVSIGGASVTKTSIGGDRTAETYGLAGTEVIRPAVTTLWAAGSTASFALSSGPTVAKVNGTPSSGLPSFPWACGTANGGSPWHHGSYVKSRLVVWHKAGSTMDKWGNYTQRTDGTTTNNLTANQVDISASADGPLACPWTSALQDHGTYNAIGTSVSNDHEVKHYLFVSSAAYDETGLTLIPLCAQVTRCGSGGVIDTSAMGYDAFGRAGSYADDWANGFGAGPTVVSQTTWQKYWAATVINPVIVDFTMLGHNAAASERDGSDRLNATFAANVVTYINRKKAAAVAGGFTYYPIVVAPWRSSATSQFNSVAKCQYATAIYQSIAASVNGGWFSYLEAFGNQQPISTLHPQTRADGMLLANTILEAGHRATNFQYSNLGTAPARIVTLED